MDKDMDMDKGMSAHKVVQLDIRCYTLVVDNKVQALEELDSRVEEVPDIRVPERSKASGNMAVNNMVDKVVADNNSSHTLLLSVFAS